MVDASSPTLGARRSLVMTDAEQYAGQGVARMEQRKPSVEHPPTLFLSVKPPLQLQLLRARVFIFHHM